MKDIHQLLERIQIKPKNLSLYELALTHSSFNADANTIDLEFDVLHDRSMQNADYIAFQKGLR